MNANELVCEPGRIGRGAKVHWIAKRGRWAYCSPWNTSGRCTPVGQSTPITCEKCIATGPMTEKEGE